MDLKEEASSSSRILTARHVGVDHHKSVSEYNDLTNSSSYCDTAIPDIESYFSALGSYGVVLAICGLLLVLSVVALWWDTIRTTRLRNPSREVKRRTILVVSVYPVVACSSFCAILMPRSLLLAEAFIQGMFMIAMYQFFCLIIAYFGGEGELIRRLKPALLETRVLPCCCWPCCFIPQPSVDKKTLQSLRLLVLQLPIVQGILYLIQILMWFEDQEVYRTYFLYLQPVIIVSILTGIWGVIMTCRTSEVAAPEGLKLRAKFLVLQLVLITSKVQGFAARMFATSSILPCYTTLNPAVYCNLIYHSILLLETLLLALWARFLYRAPLPEEDNTSVRVQQVKVFCVNQNGAKVAGNDDGLDNKGFGPE